MAKTQIELRENENLLEEVKGDYWKTGLLKKQISGKYTFTDQRIVFTPTMLVDILEDVIEIEYDSIAEINKGMISFIVPTGIKVMQKDGKKHLLSLLKRGKWMDLINSKMNK